jgi:hypothetical protein
LYVYFHSLHVSGATCPPSGGLTVSMWHLVFVTLCGWPSGMQSGKTASFLPSSPSTAAL